MKKAFALILGMLVLAGCAQKIEDSQADEVISNARPVTQSMLTSLEQGDLNGFTENMSPEMKDYFSEDKFQELRTYVSENLGSFKSLNEASVDLVQRYYRVSFSASFEKDNATVLVSFLENDLSTVQGLFFQ